jgi:hypothetical protein
MQPQGRCETVWFRRHLNEERFTMAQQEAAPKTRSYRTFYFRIYV